MPIKIGLSGGEKEDIKAKKGDLSERSLAVASSSSRDPPLLKLQARVLLQLERDGKLESTTAHFGISFYLFPCLFSFMWLSRDGDMLVYFPLAMN
ncbi:hypothetical protein GQ457_15G020200 [Hibiscus cannabinus]